MDYEQNITMYLKRHTICYSYPPDERFWGLLSTTNTFPPHNYYCCRLKTVLEPPLPRFVAIFGMGIWQNPVSDASTLLSTFSPHTSSKCYNFSQVLVLILKCSKVRQVLCCRRCDCNELNESIKQPKVSTGSSVRLSVVGRFVKLASS